MTPIRSSWWITLVCLTAISQAARLQVNTDVKLGHVCDQSDFSRYPMYGSRYHYIYCHEKHGVFEMDECPSIQHQQKVFIPERQACDFDMTKQSGFGLGSQCQKSLDCMTGMGCVKAVCSCDDDHVQIGKYCWKKSAPRGEPCSFDIQCEAVWPGGKCVEHSCKCPAGMVDVLVGQKVLCSLPNECPFGGSLSVLYLPNSNTLATCLKEENSTKAGICHVNGVDVSHMYDCIDEKYFSSPICCPNRATICNQPLMPGNGTVDQIRFYFSAVENECKPYLYKGGMALNANSFLSKQHCDHFCAAANPDSVLTGTEATNCSQLGVCPANHSCQLQTDSDVVHCYKDPESRCHSYSNDTEGAVEYHVGFSAGGKQSGTRGVIRYHFSATKNKCRPFVYKGEGGDFNNFLTEAHCENICAPKLCPHSTPLRHPNSSAVQCGVENVCPSEHSCSASGVCCPTQEIVCRKPLASGNCGRHIIAFGFNYTAGKCQLFNDSGCEGNSNNFRSMAACESFCHDVSRPTIVCPSGQTTEMLQNCTTTAALCPSGYHCHVADNKAGCCPQINTTTTVVTTTEAIQSTTKMSKVAHSASKKTESFCPYGNAVAQVCSADSDCADLHYCHSFTGLAGPIQRCCPSKAYICRQPLSIGTTDCDKGLITRYYYHYPSRVCFPFHFSGCGGGNGNDFTTLEQCKNFCSSSACAVGEVIYEESGRPFNCASGRRSQCPEGFTCRPDMLNDNFVCCGAPSSTDFCPNGRHPFVDEKTKGIQTCADRHDSCPDGFACERNSAGSHYCCSYQKDTPIKEICVGGSMPIMNETSARPYDCSLALQRYCPVGYYCEGFDQRISRNGICCPKRVSPSQACPYGQMGFTNPMTGFVQFCHARSEHACPIGHHCYKHNPSSQDEIGVCCRDPVRNIVEVVSTTSTAPTTTAKTTVASTTSTTPMSTTTTSSTTTKSPQSTTVKPPMRSTPADVKNNRPPVATWQHNKPYRFGAVCPAGLIDFKLSNRSLSCNPAATDSCPKNYYCMYSSVFYSYVCCGIDSGCPAGQIPYIERSNKDAAVCNPFNHGSYAMNQCPPEYSCTWSPSHQRYQCCGLDAGCPNSRVAFINPNSGTPLACVDNAVCPSGYTCARTYTGEGHICCANDESWKNVCEFGLPLTLNDSKTVSCSGNNSTCPYNYECVSKGSESLCCPSKGYLCSQSLSVGTPCYQQLQQTRYHFNRVTKRCESFTFTGCGGNDNNFRSDLECQNACSSQTICEVGEPLMKGRLPVSCSAENRCEGPYRCAQSNGHSYCCPCPFATCKLPPDAGLTCDAVSSELFWHFDAATASCQTFRYSGCQGNYNRYTSEAQCRSYCHQTLCKRGQPMALEGSSQPRFCDFRSPCSVGYGCEKPNLNFTGIGNMCCPTAELICRLPVSEGDNCGETQKRFSYDQKSGDCVEFSYLGCSGNDNNFATKEECQQFCQLETDFCPSGSDIYLHPENRLPVTCSPYHTSCPSGYRCHSKSPTTFFCCAEIPAPTCPSGEKPFTAVGETSAQECSKGRPSVCPSGYSCEETANGKSVCCPAQSDDVCLSGSKPYRDDQSKLIQFCYENNQHCPSNHVCYFSEKLQHYVCCSHEAPEPPRDVSGQSIAQGALGCPRGLVAYSDRQSGAAVRCSPYEINSCPLGYHCLYSTEFTRYQCCAESEVISQGWSACPGSMEPLINVLTDQPQVCQPGLFRGCGPNYVCRYSPTFWQYICCGQSESTKATEYSAQQLAVGKFEGLFPGQFGCVNDEQCGMTFPGAKCRYAVCHCPPNLVVYQGTCVPNCPYGYSNSNGRCLMTSVLHSHRDDVVVDIK